jgi:hypothetical protein
MELKTKEFFVLKGKKNYIFPDEAGAIDQIKKDKDTDVELVRVDMTEEKWSLQTVGWNEIAKHLMR